MTGGVPYGRPMPEIAPDRDGLTLDQLSLRVGPFFPPFPSGLTLSVKLQGDVIQEAVIGENPFSGFRLTRDQERGNPFLRALSQSVPIIDIEMARACHHLHWLARTLRVHGLHALGLRSLAMARSIRPGVVAPVAELRRILRRTQSISFGGKRIGVTPLDRVRNRGLGLLARAAGSGEDLRAEDPAYLALGFQPIVQVGGDVRSRFLQRLDEAVQSVELAGRSRDAMTGATGRTEGPRGVITLAAAPTSMLLELLPELLAGLEWGDAVSTVLSLDLDLRDIPPSKLS